MKSGFKLALITLPITAIGAGVLAFIIMTSPPPAQQPVSERMTAVRVIIGKSQAVAPKVTGFGIVTPARTFEAIAQVGGSVVYVNPDLRKGAILPAGSVLARLSSVDFDLAIAQANANIRASEAKLAEVTVSEANQRTALAIENEVLALKTQDLDRAQTLFSGGTIPQSALDGARSNVLAQRQKMLAIESTLALLPTQRDVQLEQIAVYQANLETAKLNLARTEFTLPFTARVANVSIETGQFVRVGQTISILDGIEIAEVEAQLSVAALQKLLQAAHTDTALIATDPTQLTGVLRGLDLGASVRLSLDQSSVTWPAIVDRISDSIDPKTGTLGVILQIETAYSSAQPGQRPPLTKGMFVEVSLSATPVTGIVVPRSALREGVLLIANDDDRLEQLTVTSSLTQGAISLITDKLAEGARIIVSDPSPVITGMLLTVIEDTALSERLMGAEQMK